MLSNVGGAFPIANAAEGKVDAIAPVAMVANAARRVTSLFMLRAVDALLVGAGAKALALATRDRVIAVENFILIIYVLVCLNCVTSIRLRMGKDPL